MSPIPKEGCDEAAIVEVNDSRLRNRSQ